MGTKGRLCAVDSCDAAVFDKRDKFCMKHIPISFTERVRDFDITEKTSMASLISDMRAITRYTWYIRPSEDAMYVAEHSLRLAGEWKMVCYDAITRLAVIAHYVYTAHDALREWSNEGSNVQGSLPEPPDPKPLVETGASLSYLMENFQIHAARFSDLSRDVTPIHYKKRKTYLQAADVWWKSRLKVEALREAVGWLSFSLKKFDARMRLGRSKEGLSEQDRTVLQMDAEVLGGLAEALFKTVLLHYQELISL